MTNNQAFERPSIAVVHSLEKRQQRNVDRDWRRIIIYQFIGRVRALEPFPRLSEGFSRGFVSLSRRWFSVLVPLLSPIRTDAASSSLFSGSANPVAREVDGSKWARRANEWTKDLRRIGQTARDSCREQMIRFFSSECCSSYRQRGKIENRTKKELTRKI